MGSKLEFRTAYHIGTDRQSERTIQMLEDMLRAFMLGSRVPWEDSLRLIEFANNNSY